MGIVILPLRIPNFLYPNDMPFTSGNVIPFLKSECILPSIPLTLHKGIFPGIEKPESLRKLDRNCVLHCILPEFEELELNGLN
jgi:hypothetical protein